MTWGRVTEKTTNINFIVEMIDIYTHTKRFVDLVINNRWNNWSVSTENVGSIKLYYGWLVEYLLLMYLTFATVIAVELN